MNALSEEKHNELLRIVAEMRAYVEAGYVSHTSIFSTLLNRIDEILWELVET